MTKTQEKPPKGTYPNKIEEFRLRCAPLIRREEIQKALKISQPALQFLLDGRVRLSVDKAVIIAKILNCNPSDLSDELNTAFGDSSPPRTDPAQLAEFLFAGMNAERKMKPELLDKLRYYLSFEIDYASKHEGIEGAEKYVDKALAFLKQAEKEKK